MTEHAASYPTHPTTFSAPADSYLLQEITLRHLLSFGPAAEPIALERLDAAKDSVNICPISND